MFKFPPTHTEQAVLLVLYDYIMVRQCNNVFKSILFILQWCNRYIWIQHCFHIQKVFMQSTNMACFDTDGYNIPPKQSKDSFCSLWEQRKNIELNKHTLIFLFWTKAPYFWKFWAFVPNYKMQIVNISMQVVWYSAGLHYTSRTKCSDTQPKGACK